MPVTIDGSTAVQPTGPMMAVDARGVRHYGWATSTSIRYGRCAGACDKAASWETTTVGSGGGMYFTMAVSQSGAVHITWRPWAYSTTSTMKYARCTQSNCASPSAWTVAAPLSGSSVPSASTDRSSLVDEAGTLWVAALVGAGNGVLRCAGDCTQSSSWSTVTLDSRSCMRAAIAQTPNRIGVACTPGRTSIAFSECNKSSATHCASASDWTTTWVTNDETTYDIDLTFEGEAPRIAHYDKDSRPTLRSRQNGAWTAIVFTGVDAGLAKGISLASNPSGFTAVAIQYNSNLWVGTCSGNCFAVGSQWSWTMADTDAWAHADGLTVPPGNCTGNEQPLAFSIVAEWPRLELVGSKVALLSMASDLVACFPKLGTTSFYRPRYFEF